MPNITIDLNDKTIHGYTEGDIREFIRHKCKLKDEDKKNSFAKTLSRRAEGTFLWVALAMKDEGLEDPLTQEEIAKGNDAYLDRFPSGLYPMYSRILLEVLRTPYRNERCKEMVVILHYLALSQRPLSEEELCHIVPEPDERIKDTLDAFRNIISRRKDSPDHDEPIKLHLIHLSLKDYLVLEKPWQRVFFTKICWTVSWRVRPWLDIMVIWLSGWSQVLWKLECLLLPILVRTVFMLPNWIAVSGFLYICFFERKSLILYQLKKLLNTIAFIIFGINEPEVHSGMFRRCVAFMMAEKNGFKKDMCDIEKLGPLESEERAKAQEKGHTFEYPCHFWACHLAHKGGGSFHDLLDEAVTAPLPGPSHHHWEPSTQGQD